jgi:hypothetical protein
MPGTLLLDRIGGRPVFLHFTDVTEEDLAKCAEATTKETVKRLLLDCMKVDQAEGFRTESLADMHYHNYAFCMSRQFTTEKTSTFLSIMKIVLEEAVARRLVVDDAFTLFKEWLLKHSVERPPWSIGIFSFDDVKALTGYVHDTFLRHYRLYMYVFRTHHNLVFRLDSSGADIAPSAMRVPPMRVPDETELQPTEAEMAEAARNLSKQDDVPTDRVALIKGKIETRFKELKESFEPRLKELEMREKELALQEQDFKG